jgi:hypothetical protein
MDAIKNIHAERAARKAEAARVLAKLTTYQSEVTKLG